MTAPKKSQGPPGEAACGLPSDELHRAFDGEPTAQDVAGHVAACDPCSSALQVLETQRDAVQFLSGATLARGGDTAVEHILSTSARVGREKLADLLYELSKACLVLVPDLKRRVERKVEPREADVVSADLAQLNQRIADGEVEPAVSSVLSSEASEANAIGACQSCITILGNVEGESERQQLMLSQLQISQGRPADAEVVLRAMLDSGRALRHRDLVERNTMWALIRQEKYSDAAALGEVALQGGNNDPVVLFNLAVSNAHLQDHDRFAEVAVRLSPDSDVPVPDWLRELIQYEAPRLAGDLGVEEHRVRALLGIGASSMDSSS